MVLWTRIWQIHFCTDMENEQLLGANSVIFLMLSNLGPDYFVQQQTDGWIHSIHCRTFNEVACVSPRETVPIGLIKGMYSLVLQHWRNSVSTENYRQHNFRAFMFSRGPIKKLQSCKTFPRNSQFLWGEWLRNQQIHWKWKCYMY